MLFSDLDDVIVILYGKLMIFEKKLQFFFVKQGIVDNLSMCP